MWEYKKLPFSCDLIFCILTIWSNLVSKRFVRSCLRSKTQKIAIFLQLVNVFLIPRPMCLWGRGRGLCLKKIFLTHRPLLFFFGWGGGEEIKKLFGIFWFLKEVEKIRSVKYTKGSSENMCQRQRYFLPEMSTSRKMFAELFDLPKRLTLSCTHTFFCFEFEIFLFLRHQKM